MQNQRLLHPFASLAHTDLLGDRGSHGHGAVICKEVMTQQHGMANPQGSAARTLGRNSLTVMKRGPAAQRFRSTPKLTASRPPGTFHVPPSRARAALRCGGGLGASLDMVPKFQFFIQKAFDVGSVSRDKYKQFRAARPVTPKV